MKYGSTYGSVPGSGCWVVLAVLGRSLVELSSTLGVRLRGTSLPLVEFMYLVFKRMPGASNGRRLVSFLLYFCHVVRALITSLVC